MEPDRVDQGPPITVAVNREAPKLRNARDE